ncbi:MAG: sulfotransferase [bacterium]|nr:sulfotransferase [bacterium]
MGAKCPRHLEQIVPLVETFPDTTFVVTHRAPVSVVQSAATMNCYSARIQYTKIRPDWYLDYWARCVVQLLEAFVRDRFLLPADRIHDVDFHEFVKDPFSTVEEIYGAAKLEKTDVAHGEIRAQPEGHQRGRFGRVAYDLHVDFGVRWEISRWSRANDPRQ